MSSTAQRILHQAPAKHAESTFWPLLRHSQPAVGPNSNLAKFSAGASGSQGSGHGQQAAATCKLLRKSSTARLGAWSVPGEPSTRSTPPSHSRRPSRRSTAATLNPSTRMAAITSAPRLILHRRCASLHAPKLLACQHCSAWCHTPAELALTS